MVDSSHLPDADLESRDDELLGIAAAGAVGNVRNLPGIVRGYVTRFLSELSEVNPALDKATIGRRADAAAESLRRRILKALDETIEAETDRAIFFAIQQKATNREAALRIESRLQTLREKEELFSTRKPLPPRETHRPAKHFLCSLTLDEIVLVVRFDDALAREKGKRIHQRKRIHRHRGVRGLKAELLENYLAERHVIEPHGDPVFVRKDQYAKIQARVNDLQPATKEWAVNAVESRVKNCDCKGCLHQRKQEKN